MGKILRTDSQNCPSDNAGSVSPRQSDGLVGGSGLDGCSVIDNGVKERVCKLVELGVWCDRVCGNEVSWFGEVLAVDREFDQVGSLVSKRYVLHASSDGGIRDPSDKGALVGGW